ncbi:MAG: amino acid decarboxylase [Rhodobacteraceae bacterium]|jgi:glutamate/tyrosine decarboxylase-like PLP-dependent enzyme|nr:amino acid decarboxylase [Paracoccaceae bacterium]
MPDPAPASLDPEDWDAFAATAHRMVDTAIRHTRGLRDRPLWREMPAATRRLFAAPLPLVPTPLATVCDDVRDHILAYPLGNAHPRYWMWFMGASNLTGAIGDFLAAVNASNLHGGNHAARLVDDQVVRWLAEIAGFPATAAGTLVSGGSVANLIGHAVARHAFAAARGIDLRQDGVVALAPRPRVYCSAQAHGCHQKAAEVLGLGNVSLRRIPTGPDLAMDMDALGTAIAEDRRAGWAPATVVATAGTVNSGAIDPLPGIAELCRREGLWFHVDGCIGALAALAPRHRHLVAGIEAADSLALDPHKWLHAPFELGCALVRDGTALLRTFSLTPEYLKGATRGIAAGTAHHLCDLGLQTTRGFRALKLWMSLREHGANHFGALIDRNIDQARLLACRLEAAGVEVHRPVGLNIVCFRHRVPGLDAAAMQQFNREVMIGLQEEGLAAVSDTVLDGRHYLRAAIANHRTADADIDLFVDAFLRAARRRALSPAG